MIRFLPALFLIAGALSGCTSSHKKSLRTTQTEQSQQKQFEQGIRALDAGNYEEAARIFDRLLVQRPANELDLVTLYNSGAAYQGMGDCQKAADRYREVVRSSAGKFGRVEGEALFHLSLMYECLGQDTKTITALLDAKKRGKELPYETSQAEIPARLAAAYARLGNRAKALEYFNQASSGLKTLVARGGTKAQLEIISRTLFLMGQLSPNQRRGEVESTTYLQSISMQQPYLLQALELKDPHWSLKAEDDLNRAYANIWKFKFKNQEQEHQFYLRCLQTINELRKIRMPKAGGDERSIFVTLDETERKLKIQLSRVAENIPLTPEAEKREGLRREGRLVDPSPSAAGPKAKPNIKK